MKVLAIRGKNIASLDGEFELDFTAAPLAGAGIFAIAGPTGAGKSTLLDVMCLALFARTPRTDQAKENEVWLRDVKDSALTQGDSRNLLRRGTAAGYAEVDFVALNGHRYRSRWAVRRARDKESGALQGFKITLFNVDTETEEQGSRKELQARITELIGLTFDQFTRSVLLAQNDFSTFLKADQSEKASLLEKLTGTESFSAISQLIYQKNAQAKDAYEQVRSRIEGVELLTDEELEQMQSAARQAEEVLLLLNKSKASVEVKQNWFRELALLLENVQQARQEIVVARKAWEEGRPRASYLDLVVQVQEARSAYDAEKNASFTRIEKQKQLEEIEGQVTRTFTCQEEIRSRYQTEQKETEALELSYKQTEPELKEARKLEVQAEEAARNLETLKRRLEKAEAECRQNETQTTAIGNQLRQHAEEKSAVEAWQEKHRSREHVAEQISVFGIQLDRAEAARLAAADAGKRLAALQISIQRKEEEIRTRRKKAEVQNRTLQQMEETLAALEKLQQEYSGEALRQDIHSVRRRKELFAAATITWKELYKVRKEIASKEQEITDQEALQVTAGKELAAHEISFRDALQRKEQSERIYNSAMLAVAGDVEQMRSHLEEGLPCPVCGSTHHPYMGTEEKLHQAFAAIRHEKEAAAALYDSELKATERCRQTVAGLVKEIERLRKETETLLRQWEALEAQWTSYNLESSNLPDKGSQPEDSQRESWLASVCEEIDRRLEQLQQQEAQYAARQQQLQQLQKERMELHRKLTALNKETDSLLHEKTLEEKSLANEQLSIATQQEALQKAVEATNELFGNELWQVAWNDNPALFREKLTSFAQEWKKKKEVLQQQQLVAEGLLAEQKTLTSFFPSLLKEKEECRKLFEQQQRQLEQLKRERAALFGGRPAAEVEQEFKYRIEAGKEKVAYTLEALNQASHVYEQAKGTAAQIERDLQQMTLQAARYKKQLEEWLAGFNANRLAPLSYDELAALLQKDGRWIQEERNLLNRLHSDLIAAEAKLQEREEKVKACDARRTELEINEATPESLRTQLDNIEAGLTEQTALLTECNFKLRRHRENKEKVKSLEEELNRKKAVSEQWAKLNELAGSSDGGKFRRLAQGYTLDILLSYANVQLRSLSKRYRLERVPDTLALQVIDRDMCDEVRTVHSLSGGESFLVSLALALGLSSLSSNRMKVESLFIDEGFGSLDADTLRMAMDALESLRTQGRKIGVISHVQEMTERIPVQVWVEKMGNGRSKVSVRG